MVIPGRFRAYAAVVLLLTLVSTATAKYSGGSGTVQDPYQIATAADLIALGETPEDYGKHFIMTADIDLDPNLPGRKVFDKAVIAPDTDPDDKVNGEPSFSGRAFTGVFDGKGHTISDLTIRGGSYLGLFGQLGAEGRVSNLGLEAVQISGTGNCVGGLVGCISSGRISSSYSTGSVSATWYAGGLVGNNRYDGGSITASYSSASVSGTGDVGGLVGFSSGRIATSYSSGSVSATWPAGGLVGSGSAPYVIACVWDTETSTVSGSPGGVGLKTVEMMDPYMLGLNGFANDPNWVLDAGRDYPRLAWQGTPGGMISEPDINWLPGQGTAAAPYRIDAAEQLILLGKASILWNRHFILGADINLNPALPGRSIFNQAVIPVFTGIFDGGGHVIANLRIKGGSDVGLFGFLMSNAEVRNIGVVDVSITDGSGGGLVGRNYYGRIAASYSSGSVSGIGYVGGLVGSNWGSIATSYSGASVCGTGYVGGLVGINSAGEITDCYGTGAVSGGGRVGGLVGLNGGRGYDGFVVRCYSSGPVSGTGDYIGGLVGSNGGGSIVSSFWATQTSGQATSAVGTGKTTAEMQTAKTFLDAGWDFAGETANGTADIWWILDGKDYPHLWWEAHP